MDQYVDAEWDGKCPICGGDAAIGVYRLLVIDSNQGPYISNVDLVYGQFFNYLDALENGVVESPVDGGTVFVSKDKDRLLYIKSGFVSACHRLALLGYNNRRISCEGIIQDN